MHQLVHLQILLQGQQAQGLLVRGSALGSDMQKKMINLRALRMKNVYFPGLEESLVLNQIPF